MRSDGEVLDRINRIKANPWYKSDGTGSYALAAANAALCHEVDVLQWVMEKPKTRREVLVSSFAEVMLYKLRLPENMAKGDDWNKCPTSWLMDRLNEEVGELNAALQALYEQNPSDPVERTKLILQVVHECGDVGNFAAFVADSIGGFEARDQVLGRK